MKQWIQQVAEATEWLEREHEGYNANISVFFDINIYRCGAACKLYRSLLCAGSAGAVEVYKDS